MDDNDTEIEDSSIFGIVKDVQFSSFLNSYVKTPCRKSDLRVSFGDFPSSADILESNAMSLHRRAFSPHRVVSPDIVFCSEPSLALNYDILKDVYSNSSSKKTLVVRTSENVGPETGDESLFESLPSGLKNSLLKKQMRLFMFNDKMAVESFLQASFQRESSQRILDVLKPIVNQISFLKVLDLHSGAVELQVNVDCYEE